ncbi:N-6 DNA methylase [Novipirellula artificiosorum]|uniref:site-specific DNA-methyltransferase (adenine-specific) n=1 Tax=Novipirellula artificiosorum TaxID=2528016 RepID=A0A5C6DZK8_9BACT|nr:N-6 DNA methylase [Novipirellula artificiosorum]TWU41885.1 putative type I restriction enzymeP M protein [Novipirellula artificiosorum]
MNGEHRLFSNMEISRLLREPLGKMPASEVNAAFAALVFLRWADFEEAEHEAISAFEDPGYQARSTSRIGWRELSDKSRYGFEKTIRHLPDIVEDFAHSRNWMIANTAHHAASAILTLSQHSVEAVGRIIEWLAYQPFETPADRLAVRDMLDEVLKNNTDRFAGEFFTPTTIANLMVQIANPQRGEAVYDPCFGSAGLLTTALESVKKRKTLPVGSANQGPNQQQLGIAGMEINSSAFMIGVTRLGLSGVSHTHLANGNSLLEPERVQSDEGFDVVLANPPWGMKIDSYEVEQLYPIPTKDSSSLFLQHALTKLHAGGRCVMVVPPSLLFRGGREQHLREWLLREHRVEAIVAMPKGAFSPHTSIETCILLIRKGGSTERVRMVKPSLDKHEITEQTTGSFMEYSEIADAVQSPKTDSIHSWDVTISQIAEHEYDLTPKRRDRSALESILDSIPKEAELRLLSDCCDIMTGRNIRANDLMQSPPKSNFEPSGQTLFPDVEREEINPQRPFSFADEPITYVRIKDVEKGQATRGSSWLMPAVASTIDDKWRLRAGDILLSKSGTIGKAGIVRDGAVGGIAASGFFVLRVNEGTIDPHYLLAYLQGTEANAWMEDRSRGSAAKNLSVRAIKDLPVALPPLQIQQRIADQHRKFGIDALTYLAELLSEDDSQSLASELNDWVSHHLKSVEGYEGDLSSRKVLELLEGVAASECPVKICKECKHPYHLDRTTNYLNSPENYAAGIATHCLACWLDVGPGSDTVESLSEQSPLVPWALAFSEASEPLKGVSRIPDPAALISVLQSIEVKLHQSTHSIEGHLPNQDRAKQLTLRVLNMIDSYTKHLVADFQIVTDVTKSTEDEQGQMRLRLTVQNKGRVPLRDVSFSLNPPMTAVLPADVSFFSPGNVVELEFEGSDQSHSDNSITALRWSDPEWSLKWTARNLAGKLVEDKLELGVEFGRAEVDQDAVDELAAESLGHSPYVTGNAVKTDRNEVFVGRDELLADIRNVIGHSGNVVLLEGNRRAGKSSILWHLVGCDSIPGWIGVYHSLHANEGDNHERAKGVPTVEVFRGIAIETAKSIQRNVGEVLLPDGSVLQQGKPGVVDIVRGAIKEDAPFTYFREYIEVLLDWLESRKLRLLFLLDEFDKLQEGIEDGVTSSGVPENLRFLLQSDTRLTAILTSMKRFRRIREEYFSALYGLGTPFNVTSLTKEDAETLVTKPIKGRLIYAPNAIGRVVFLAARQPYFLQCLCESVFLAAKSSGVRSITVDHVNDAATEVLKRRHFNDLFKYAGTDRKRFILALCHREADGPDPLRLPVIREKLSAHGIDVTEEDLTADLEWLTDLELLDFSGANDGESYSLTVPLMGLWIDTLDYTGLMSKARAESAETENAENE